MEKLLEKLFENKSIIEHLNDVQLVQIFDGIKRGLKVKDVLLYSEMTYDAEKMEFLKNLLTKGFNLYKMTPYIENLSRNQLKVVVECMQDNMEQEAIKYIVSLNCDFEDMRTVKGFIENGYKVTPYIKDRNINGITLTYVLELLKTGYITQKICELLDDNQFNMRQKQELLQALKDGLDATIFYSNSFDYMQIKFLRLKLAQGEDVTKYAKPKYSYQQMIELSALGKFDIPTELYELFLIDGHRFDSNEIVNYSEVIEAHIGGLSAEQIRFYVNAYNDEQIELDQMHEIRNQLLEGKSIDEVAFAYDIEIADYSSQEESNIIEGDF